MTCDNPQYAIAANFDNPENLLILEGYTPAGDDYAFQPLFSYGTFNPGVAIVNGDQSLSFDGFQAIQWVWSFLTYTQLQFLRDTYAAGGWSGQCTIATVTDVANEIQYWNAIARFTVLSGSRLLRPGYDSYAISFVLQEQLTFGYLLTEDSLNLVFEDGSTLIALE